MKPRSLLMILGIIVFLCAPFVVPMFSLWSRINCREQEVDVMSGMRKDTRFIYWIPIDRKVTPTPVADALSGDALASQPPRWEHVNSFGPYTNHSPHYIYHSALSQIQQLKMIWDDLEFNALQRRESAQGLLREWQATGSDRSADNYLRQQMKIE